MKRTGMFRPLDPLGRVVIPVELRRSLELETGDLVEIFVDNDYIMLKKRDDSCVFCGSNDDIVEIKGKAICQKCISEIKDGE